MLLTQFETPASGQLSADDCLERLLEGNARFVEGRPTTRTRGTLTREARALLAQRQAPFATIVSCSDSRVPSEHVFDQGLGDLFIVRNAGAAVSHAALASIEFACLKLETRLVLIMAHERCGAFRAADEVLRGGAAPSESLEELVTLLEPALRAAHDAGTTEERCERAAILHVQAVALKIAQSPVVAPLVARGLVRVVPAYFKLVEGTVEVCPV